jgi:dolichol-phosphate mannosyltransferase
MPKSRQIMSKIADKLANIILPIPAKDSMSGFFLIHKNIIEDHIQLLNPKGFKILLEILYRIPNLTLFEIGYKFKNRTLGTTKLSSGVIVEYFISLIEMRFNFKIDPIWIKYSFVGLLGIFTNILFQAIAMRLIQGDFVYQSNSDFTIPSLAILIGFEISLIQNFILNSYWTFSSSRKISSLIFQFFKFELISILGFLIQISVWGFLLTFYHNYIHQQSLYATYVFNFSGILLAYIFNYFSNINLTWKK